MKPYQIAMALALAGAAGLLVFGDNAPVADLVEPVQRADRAAAGTSTSTSTSASAATAPLATRSSGTDGQVMILRLIPRAELVGEAGDPAFGAGEGLFQGQNWNPPPPAPTAAQQAAANAPPPPPVAPPVPYNYFGKAVQDGAWEVYLARGDKTYVVRSQSVIDGAYRVDRIVPPLLTLTYLPLNQVQQINIGAID